MFEPHAREQYSAGAGVRLLAVFLILEGLLLMIRYLASMRLSQIGIYRWARWTTTEKAYFIQVVPLAVIIFTVVSAARLREIAADSSIWGGAAVTVASYLCWGFYQEVMYRGILQGVLARRLGAVTGILVANTCYTFGPLHLYYFSRYQPPTIYGMFAAVFAIGLYFGLVFQRSGNLLIVGTLHSIGNVFLTALPRLRVATP